MISIGIVFALCVVIFSYLFGFIARFLDVIVVNLFLYACLLAQIKYK